MAWDWARQVGLLVPGKYGIPVWHWPSEQPLVSLNDFLVWKSLTLPKKSHDSPREPSGLLISLVPLKSVVRSLTSQGAPLCSRMMELMDQPSRSWLRVFFPGSKYVIEAVKWSRTSNMLFPYMDF